MVRPVIDDNVPFHARCHRELKLWSESVRERAGLSELLHEPFEAVPKQIRGGAS